MIGDLVNYRPGWINEETNQVEYESGTGFPVRIEMLYYSHGEGLVQYNDGENDGIEAAEYELFPIPLTAEILEKNFQESLPGINLMYQLKGPYCAMKEDGQWVFGLVKVDGDNSARYPLVKISFVHELQHALRLCGITKEIQI